MKEQTLFMAAVVCTILGLVILYLYAEEVNLAVLESPEQWKEQQTVSIQGRVEKLHVSEKAIFVTIQGQRIDTVDAIVFTEKPIFLKEGDFVEVTGTVEEYKGTKEIIADEIVVR